MPRDNDTDKGNYKVLKKYGRFNETIRKATLQLAKRSAACAVIQEEVHALRSGRKSVKRCVRGSASPYFLRKDVSLPLATHQTYAGLHTASQLTGLTGESTPAADATACPCHLDYLYVVQILVDFIRCQEEVEQILLLQEQMMAGTGMGVP
jgi:hypothetical protein